MMHEEPVIYAGNTTNPSKALIMLHGRGAGAEDILSLARHLQVKDYLLAAPQATNNTWYPQSFLAPPAQNEPWLSAALTTIAQTVAALEARGIAKEHIYFLGFSQGACLTLEFVTRNATRYGGIVAFTGGVIGDKIYAENYHGGFSGTPVFIGTSNPDMHVPVARVHESTEVLKSMGANVATKVYDNMGHTISQDEMDLANELIFK